MSQTVDSSFAYDQWRRDLRPGKPLRAQAAYSGAIHGHTRPAEPLPLCSRIPQTCPDALDNQAFVAKGQGKEKMDAIRRLIATMEAEEHDLLRDLERQSAAAYRTVREAMNDAQLEHRSAFAEVCDGGGSFRTLNPPFRMSASAACAGTHAPALGDHTRSVLRATGFSDAEIDLIDSMS